MFATTPATARPARNSHGREMMKTTRPPVVDGLSLALQAASSDTSTYTTQTIQASYAIVPDFFNGLLGASTHVAVGLGPLRHATATAFQARGTPHRLRRRIGRSPYRALFRRNGRTG